MSNALASAPAEINLDDYREVKIVGNVQRGDILSRDSHLQVVTKVTRTAKTVELRAENGDAEPGYGSRLWISKHRNTTSVEKALGNFTRIYRKVVS